MSDPAPVAAGVGPSASPANRPEEEKGLHPALEPDGGTDSDPDGDFGGSAREGPPAGEAHLGRVPLSTLKAGELLSKTEYLRVLEVDSAQNKVRLEVLRGDKADDLWELTLSDASILARSTDLVQRELKVTRSELVKRFSSCKDDVFKIVFRPTLTPQALANQLVVFKDQIHNAETLAQKKTVAKQLMQLPTRTLRGKLILSNPALGYSLVDDLEHSDPLTPAIRHVPHQNLLALTLAGTRYLLK